MTEDRDDVILDPDEEEGGSTAVFTCAQCGVEFDSEADVSAHARQSHVGASGVTSHVCPVCEVAFPTLDQLRRHGRYQHPGG